MIKRSLFVNTNPQHEPQGSFNLRNFRERISAQIRSSSRSNQNVSLNNSITRNFIKEEPAKANPLQIPRFVKQEEERNQRKTPFVYNFHSGDTEVVKMKTSFNSSFQSQKKIDLEKKFNDIHKQIFGKQEEVKYKPRNS